MRIRFWHNPVATQSQRARWAAAQQRRRVRAGNEQSVFKIALQNNLVVGVLMASRRDAAADLGDLADHATCERLLEKMVTEFLLSRIDECRDPDLSRAALGLKSRLTVA